MILNHSRCRSGSFQNCYYVAQSSLIATRLLLVIALLDVNILCMEVMIYDIKPKKTLSFHEVFQFIDNFYSKEFRFKPLQLLAFHFKILLESKRQVVAYHMMVCYQGGSGPIFDRVRVSYVEDAYPRVRVSYVGYAYPT